MPGRKRKPRLRMKAQRLHTWDGSDIQVQGRGGTIAIPSGWMFLRNFTGLFVFDVQVVGGPHAGLRGQVGKLTIREAGFRRPVGSRVAAED